jgi:hypothetical protein
MRKLMIPVAGAFALAGCSGSSTTRTLSGQLDVSTLHLSNPQIVAISSSGRVYRAPIAANGAFQITLPAHATYSLRFANSTTAAERFDTFAILAVHKVGGTSHWFTLTPGAPILMGRVAQAGTAAAASSGLSTASTGETESDGADQESEQEDDGAEACDLSLGQDQADVESEHDVNDDVDSDHDGTPDSKESAAADDRESCAFKSDDGESCKLGDDQEHELDSDAQQPCASGADGGSPAPVPGLK